MKNSTVILEKICRQFIATTQTTEDKLYLRQNFYDSITEFRITIDKCKY